jgi:transposase
MNPPDRALVLCVDEKPQIQATEGTAPVQPMRPGQVERHTHDDIRHGTTDLFAALDVKTGTVIGACRQRHRAVEFRAFLDQIERSVPPDLDIHLVLDNASTHKAPLIQQWLVKRPRYHLHFTPTSGSWLNGDGFAVLASGGSLRDGRGMVRLADRSSTPAGEVPQHPLSGAGGSPLHRNNKPEPQALHLDQDRRRHPGQHPALLSKDF